MSAFSEGADWGMACSAEGVRQCISCSNEPADKQRLRGGFCHTDTGKMSLYAAKHK
jgi:hypothetical protein